MLLRIFTGIKQLVELRKSMIEERNSSERKSLSCTRKIFSRFVTRPAFSAAITAVGEVCSTNYEIKVRTSSRYFASTSGIGSESFVAILLTYSQRSMVSERNPAR